MVKALSYSPGCLRIACAAFAEHLGEPVDLAGSRPPDQRPPVRGQLDDDTATIIAVGAPDNQGVSFEPRDELGHCGLGHALAACELPEPAGSFITEGGQY